MPKLHISNQPVITHEFLSQILKGYGIEKFSFEFATSGIENTTVIISSPSGKIVIRVYRKNNKSREDIETEVSFMDTLAAANIPVPAIRSAKNGQRIGELQADNAVWRYIVVEFIPGEHPKEYTPALIKELANIQAAMHRLGGNFRPANKPKGDSALELMETFNTQIDRGKIKNPSVSAFLDRAQDFKVVLLETLPFSYNHLDLDIDNILTRKNKIVAILDFDDLEYTPSVMCLGYTLWHLLYETKDIDQLRTYLKAYAQLRPLQDKEEKYLLPVMLFRNYVLAIFEVLLRGARPEKLDWYIKLEKIITSLDTKDLAYDN